jgi:predicted ribonuclease YlaK
MEKKFLVDTNVLIRHPEVLDEYNCVVTSYVNDEVEKLELRLGDSALQYQIRQMKKKLDNLEVVPFDFRTCEFTLNDKWDKNYVDNILVQFAHDNGYGIITEDRALRIKCRTYGIEVVKVESSNYVDHKGFQVFELAEHNLYGMLAQPLKNHLNLMVNEYAIINDILNPKELLDILKWDGKELMSLRDENGMLGAEFSTMLFDKFAPLDEFQIMAVDSIRTNQLTAIRGRAGSGKSYVTLNTAWELVEKEQYKLVIFCNATPTRDSQELGYYTGDRLGKIMQSSAGTMLKAKFGGEDGLIKQIAVGNIDILPFADLRGYDTGDTKTIVWMLEAQNLTSDLLKLGLQRISENTKVIVDGDFHQQTDRDVYTFNNGMKRMSEIFRGKKLYGEIELQYVHRSKIADIADDM